MSETARKRNTTRQREAGAASRAETRRRLEVAAAELFVERGYTETTVSEIARRAGVSVQTLYLACGSKAELLTTVLGQALRGVSAGTPKGSVADYRAELLAEMATAVGTEPGAAPDPVAVLRGFAAVFRRIAGHAAPFWRTFSDAAAGDREIAEQWRRQNRGRRETTATLLDGLTGLRTDLTTDQVIDTVWTIASPETCDLLVRQAGYTLDAYESWIADTLVAVLLPHRR